MKYLPFLLILVALFAACTRQADTTQRQEPLTAQLIVDFAIDAHGGSAYSAAHVQYVFRDREYELFRRGGAYRYERRFEQEGSAVRDILSNESFIREIDGQPVAIADSFAFKYSNSVNSVHYFAQLPYGLNDPAVNKKYLGKIELKGKTYHKVEIKFQEEGGGKDFDDVFVYWIDAETFYVDYLAYSYETDGGGLRFREAYNPRTVAGIRFQDYVNYKADVKAWTVQELDRAFEEGALVELSRIELEDIEAL